MKKSFIKELNFEINDFSSKSEIQTKKSKQPINTNIETELEYKYSNDNIYYKSEIALWKAVILQALVDLQSNSKKKIANTYRVKSLMWFNIKNKDFITVCGYAGLDPQYVYEKSKIIKENSNFL